MKILQLCIKPPYPPVDGGTMAMNGITQGLLRAGHSVKVLTVESAKHPLRENELTDEYRRQTGIESVFVDLSVHPLPALAALLTGESYNVKRYESAAFAQKLRAILDADEYDIVHVESIFLTPYLNLIRRHSKAKVILRAHNVEHRIWQQMAKSEHGLKKIYIRHLALALRVYELEHLNDYDGVACISANDADYFRQNGLRRPVTVIPFGIEPEDTPHVDEEPATLFHIGAMDWAPNLEAVDWLLNDIWPVVHREVPTARLFLAGRKMPARLMNAHIEGVTVVGEVPDANYFIAGRQINIVPLRSGSGIRVKIIEAMSMGKTVVTTSVGAQGIEYTDGENILIADTPDGFARQVKRCVDDQDFCHSIGKAAANLIATHYDNDALCERLTTFYNEIVER